MKIRGSRIAAGAIALLLALTAALAVGASTLAQQTAGRCVNFTQKTYVALQDELNPDVALGGVTFQISASSTQATTFEYTVLETGAKQTYAIPPGMTQSGTGIPLLAGQQELTVKITEKNAEGLSFGLPAEAKVVRPGSDAALAGDTSAQPACAYQAPGGPTTTPTPADPNVPPTQPAGTGCRWVWVPNPYPAPNAPAGSWQRVCRVNLPIVRG